MITALMKPCTLKLHLLEDVIILRPPEYPTPENYQGPPLGKDGIVRGLVEVYVPKRRNIEAIEVRLTGVQTVASLDDNGRMMQDLWEETVFLDSSLVFNSEMDQPKTKANEFVGRFESIRCNPADGTLELRKDLVTSKRCELSCKKRKVPFILEEGLHCFEFAFLIPSDSPPYERSRFGRVRYHIEARILGTGNGFGRNDLRDKREIFPGVNMSPDNGLTPLNLIYQGFNPHLGIFSVTCTSVNISVGGVIDFELSFPNAAPDLIVYQIQIYLESSVELRMRKREKKVLPCGKHLLFSKGRLPPKDDEGVSRPDKAVNGEYIKDVGGPNSTTTTTVRGTVRLPNDNVIRASTPLASKSGIRMSHSLVVAIKHSREACNSAALIEDEDLPTRDGRKVKDFLIRQPITVPSCCTAFTALHSLPAYSKEDPQLLKDSRSGGGAGSGRGKRSVAAAAAASSNLANSSLDKLHPSLPWLSKDGSSKNGWRGTCHERCVCGMSFEELVKDHSNLASDQRNGSEISGPGSLTHNSTVTTTTNSSSFTRLTGATTLDGIDTGIFIKGHQPG
ncbi:hypothetical protein IE53DRAFT_371620 [Violaceomyces palustris]|uniref:Uncharacterized protein n=1 Tax=Violaceomyces palustris TaxID=1673888 RepID=A0ACD0NN81_9BASI|nr:hypothetical protein IE53DRAFT_371620 [Violaceomyces palustris]